MTRSGDPATDDATARAALPRLDDLTGPGWSVDEEDDDEHGRGPTPVDDDLGAGFPDGAVTATAEVTFVRLGAGVRPGLVHALATVLDDPATARTAWTVSAGADFARRFAESVAAEVAGRAGPGEVELLGPIAPLPTFSLDRAGRRLATHRATWSRVERGGLLPVTLDLATLVQGRVLVVLWSIDGDRAGADAAWEHLVARAALRAEAADGP